MASNDVCPAGPEADLSFLLARLGRVVNRRVQAALTPSGLNAAQTWALIQLAQRGPLGQQALGEVLDMDPSNLVALLNHLETEGLITRRRDPADRRRHIVAVTARANKRLVRMQRTVQDVEGEFFAALSEEEFGQLHVLLERVARDNELPSMIELQNPIS